MDKAWRDWLYNNILAGDSLTDLLARMKEAGFEDNVIIEALQDMGQEKDPVIPSPIDYQGLSTIRITRDARARKVPTDDLQVYEFENFMSPAECAHMVGLVKNNLVRSAVGSEELYSAARTSTTCVLGYIESEPFIEAIDKRIAETIGIDLIYSDIIEGQHYAVGQEFKPHFDCFVRGLGKHHEFTKTLGNRTWTFMVYLNDDFEGGGTDFFHLKKTFQPKMGKAVIWNNLLPNGDLNSFSLHAGTPIISGEKIVITKWFRECAKTPMFLA